MPRIRKAWLIHLDGYDEPARIFAESGSKAKYELYVQMDTSMSFGEFLERAGVQRDQDKDMTLPDRHPLATQINPKILHNVVHAYGGTGLKAGYRDHFYTSEADHLMKAAYYHGLFEMYRVPKSYAGSRDAISYILTDLGKNVAAGEAEHYPNH